MERADSTAGHRDDGRDPSGARHREQVLFDDAWAALEHALGSLDFDQAVDLVRSRWFDLLTGPLVDLRGLLDQAPSSDVEAHPLLTALRARCELTFPDLRAQGARRIAEAGAALRAAGWADAARDAGRIDRAIVLATQAELQRSRGRSEQARAAARAALAELAALTKLDGRWSDTVSGLHAQAAASLLYTGATADALAAVESGLELAQSSALTPSPGNLAMLASLTTWLGDTAEARQYIHSARAEGSLGRADDAALIQLAEAQLALDVLDHATARERLAAADIDLGTSRHWVPFVMVSAVTELVSGLPGRALAFIDQAARARGPEAAADAVRSALAPLRSVLEVALGHPDAAAAILERDTLSEVDRRLGRARIELMLGRHGAALQQLRRLYAAAMPTRQRVEAGTLEAAALLRFATEQRAAPVIDHLGALLERTGLLLPLVVLPAPDLARVTDALAHLGYATPAALQRLHSLLPDDGPEIVLTQRERAVLAALLESPSRAAIAARLSVSVNTVKSQLASVYRKLGVSTRDEAIAVAIDRNLLVERD